MKFKLFLVIFIFLISKIISEEVNIGELNRNYKNIKFKNFEGISDRNDKTEAILNIGVFLATSIKLDNTIYSYFLKYTIVHLSDNEKTGKLSADIFSIEKKAETNTVNNVILIISGYLQERYKYDYSLSLSIAELIVYYNAYYRNNINYYKTIYIENLFNYVNEKNLGISTVYKEWAGNTKIVIPLTKINNEYTISLKELTKPEIEKLTKLDDKAKKNIEDQIIKENDVPVENKKPDIVLPTNFISFLMFNKGKNVKVNINEKMDSLIGNYKKEYNNHRKLIIYVKGKLVEVFDTAIIVETNNTFENIPIFEIEAVEVYE